MKKLVALILSVCLCFCFTGCNSVQYKDALRLFDEGNYESALIIFESLDNYKSSQLFTQKCNYNLGMVHFEEGRYEKALSFFEKTGEFEDAPEYVRECKYKTALILLNLIPGPSSTAASFIASDITQTLASDANMNEAMLLLESIGDYEDSQSLLKQLGYRQEYDNAVLLFEEGSFEDASAIFERLVEADYPYAERYTSAINVFSKIAGTWSTDLEGTIDYDAYYNDQMVNGDISCKIGPPYSIGGSRFSDCDWSANATITLDAGYYMVTYSFGGSDLNYKTFSRVLQEGFHHQTDNEEPTIGEPGEYIFIINEKPYDFLFTSNNGIYSKIVIKFNDDYSKMTISETPYDMNWSKAYYSDYYSVTLTKE